MEPPYDEFAQRWGNNEFSAYVRALAGQADAALARVSEVWPCNAAESLR